MPSTEVWQKSGLFGCEPPFVLACKPNIVSSKFNMRPYQHVAFIREASRQVFVLLMVVTEGLAHCVGSRVMEEKQAVYKYKKHSHVASASVLAPSPWLPSLDCDPGCVSQIRCFLTESLLVSVLSRQQKAN